MAGGFFVSLLAFLIDWGLVHRVAGCLSLLCVTNLDNQKDIPHVQLAVKYLIAS